MNPPREEYTGIKVNPDGKWINKQGQEITNPKVLDYFRKNLKRDDKGFYIFNQFGELSEKGYIEIEGPPFITEGFFDNDFAVSGGIKVSSENAQIVLTDDEQLLLKINDPGVWSRFSRVLRTIVLSEMLETAEGYKWIDIMIRPAGRIKWNIPQ